MDTAGPGARIALSNVLYLADFSEPSEAALQFALAIGREFGATIHALHVLTPAPLICAAPETAGVAIEAQEEAAETEMQGVEAQLAGVPHDTILVRAFSVWPALEKAMADTHADLLVLGTHGRTGARKLLLGSVAEEIFRRSPIPVLTIGPWARKGMHNAAHFHRVLYATDFTPEALAAAPFAISLAQENEARLILLHVVRDHEGENRRNVESVANLMYELYKIVPKNAELWCRPEGVVEYGEPAARILEAAKQRNVDLIVLGVRGTAGRLRAATHLGRAVAHKVVAHAGCPVLTVRG